MRSTIHKLRLLLCVPMLLYFSLAALNVASAQDAAAGGSLCEDLCDDAHTLCISGCGVPCTLPNSQACKACEDTCDVARTKCKDRCDDLPASELFIRGDVNGDYRVNIADASSLVDSFLPGASALLCEDAADVNNDGVVPLSFAGGSDFGNLIDFLLHLASTTLPTLPLPFPVPGVDPPPTDTLGCDQGFVAAPDPPSAAYGFDWNLPPYFAQDAKSLDIFLEATTGGAIEAFFLAVLYNADAIDIRGVDFADTVFPPGKRVSFENSRLFAWTDVESVELGFGVLLVGAIFVDQTLLERISFPATQGPLDGERLLRIEVDVRPDAPVGEALILKPFTLGGPAAGGDGGGGGLLPGLKGAVGAISQYVRGGSSRPSEPTKAAGIIGPQIIDFQRGDSNTDGNLNIADPIFTLDFLFSGASARLLSDDSADTNDDGRIDLSDPIMALNFLFSGTESDVPQPHPQCGPDPTPDDLPAGTHHICRACHREKRIPWPPNPGLPRKE